MHLSEFDYDLPPSLIAQEPVPERDRSRLMAVRRREGTLSHHVFRDLPDLLTPGDLLVLNDTRVLPARLLGRRALTGGKWEGLFLRELPDGAWELLCQTRGRLSADEVLLVDAPPPACGAPRGECRPPSPDAPAREVQQPPERGEALRLRLVARTPEGNWLARPEAGPRAPEIGPEGRRPDTTS